MGALSNSGNIRAMNWSIAQRDWIRDEEIKGIIERERREAIANAEIIRGHLSPADYQAWWINTPDTNHDFYLATVDKVAEIKRAAAGQAAAQQARS